MAFKKAIKSESKLRLALSGPAGAGKTYTALELATELADGRPVAVIDTERGSAAKYADEFEFDVMELEPPYHPNRYMEAIRDAEAGGYAVLVIDSLTHAWNGQGGLLELHEQVVKRQSVKNSYTAWAEVTPIQNRLIDSITGSKLHIIATMRSKTEYVQEQGNNGKTSIRKVGAASIQREGMEYEFDIVGDMNQDHELIVTKTRCPALTDAIIAKPGKQVADTLRMWLSGAPTPEPTPAAMPRTPEPAAPPPANVTPMRPAAPAPTTTANGTHNPAALKLRANQLGRAKTSKEWGELFTEYKNNLQGLSDYLDAYEASLQPATVDETTEMTFALEGLPVSGMH